MSLNRNEKAAVVADVSAQAAKSQTLALAEYRGLTVEHLNKLRVDARAKGVYLHVLKNTLARRAVAGTPFEVAAETMSGPLIYGFSEDAVAAAKVIADFAKGNDKLVVKAGAYAGKALDANGVKALAAIPSREVLIAQVDTRSAHNLVASAGLRTTGHDTGLANDRTIATIAVGDPELSVGDAQLEVGLRHRTSGVGNHNEVLKLLTLGGLWHASHKCALREDDRLTGAERNRERHQ